MKEKKYTLDDVDGNAYAIMAYVCKSMRREGKTNEEIGNYFKDAHSGNYRHLIDISVEMCERLNEEDGNTRLIIVDWDDDGENMPTKVNHSIKCSCGETFIMDTLVFKCPNCKMTYAVTPCSSDNVENVKSCGIDY